MKCLLYDHEDLNLEAQHPCKRPVWWLTSTISALGGRAGTGGSCVHVCMTEKRGKFRMNDWLFKINTFAIVEDHLFNCALCFPCFVLDM